jgi:hypothetical protein
MIDDLATILENFSLMTAEFNGDKGIVDGRIAVLKKLTFVFYFSLARTVSFLHVHCTLVFSFSIASIAVHCSLSYLLSTRLQLRSVCSRCQCVTVSCLDTLSQNRNHQICRVVDDWVARIERQGRR